MNIEPFYILLGRKIQSIRDEKNISQSALGLMLEPKVTRASIANIEGGKQRVLAHTLVQLSKILETDINDLTSIEVEENIVSKEDTNREIESQLLKGLSPKTANELLSYFTEEKIKRERK